MSRWRDTFDTHAFHTTWENVKRLAKSLKALDVSVATSVTEFARLKKVVKYLDELLQAADPELLPINTWDQCNQQATEVVNQINAFISNKNISHIQNANTNLDNLLTYIRPYVLSGKGAAQAAGRALKSYAESIDDQINLLQERVAEAVQGAEENKNKSSEILGELSNTTERINELEVELLDGSEEENSLQQQFTELLDEATSWHGKIEEFHSKLTSGDEEESAIILQIEEGKDKALANSDAIDAALAESKKQLGDLKIFHGEIFGENRKDGKIVGGLKNELEQRTKELDAFRDSQQEAYEQIKIEIESLLPGATSAGLATAYHELKKSFDIPIRNYTWLFYFSIFVLFLTSLFVVTDQITIGSPENGWLDLTLIKFESISDFGIILLSKLPILLPVLWLAIFSSKRRSEANRLSQEYAHKEALAKSYQSFKKQIEKLDGSDEAMVGKLIENVIEAVAFNASSTLDKKHGDKIPLQEVVEKAVEKTASTFSLGKGGK